MSTDVSTSTTAPTPAPRPRRPPAPVVGRPPAADAVAGRRPRSSSSSRSCRCSSLPVITTVGTDFGSVLAQFGMYALLAIGLNVVVGQTGLLDLGYVGFYAIGAYTVGLLTSPDSPWNLTDDWLSTRLGVAVRGARSRSR